jgi:NIPSNAP
MALYELRTYTLRVGAMAEAVKLYQEIGFPALQKGKHDKKLIGYFQGDTGTINQILHLWKFDDDADRRAHWALYMRTRTSLRVSRQSFARC